MVLFLDHAAFHPKRWLVYAIGFAVVVCAAAAVKLRDSKHRRPAVAVPANPLRPTPTPAKTTVGAATRVPSDIPAPGSITTTRQGAGSREEVRIEWLAAQYRSLVEELQREVTAYRDERPVFAKFHRVLEEQVMPAAQDAGIAWLQLEEVRKQAITEGDGEAFDRADRQINDLKQESYQQPQIDPVAKIWLDANPWYETNAKLAVHADGLADRLVAQGYTGQAYFDELTKQIHDAFPEEFGNKNRSKPSSVESATPSSPSSKRTFDSLPADAKEAYAQFKRDIPGFTKQQFVDQYEWE